MSTSQRSWDLKVARAEQHLAEVKAAMAAYAGSNPFRAVRVQQLRGQQHLWLYRLEMTKEPDPMITVIIGESLYDLRSALDHLAVAMASRNRKASAAFPVEWSDPWEKDAAGVFAYDEERRRSFTSMVKGMPEEAVTMIKVAQPYNRKDSALETLGLISRLENADKHRQLIVLGHGVADARSVVTVGGEAIKQETAGFRPDGEEIAKFGFRNRVPRESEVTVEVSCTATIAIKLADIDGYFVLPESLEVLIRWMRDSVIPEFTPFVRPD
jgi:hypothetical protein